MLRSERRFADLIGFTGRMGKSSDPKAVVDSHGRVLGGIQGLRIVDASIFPLLPPGQLMSTVCKYRVWSLLIPFARFRTPLECCLTRYHTDALAEKLAADILKGE